MGRVFTDKKIDEIVSDNYVHASVLYHFGIRFYDYPEDTLKQVCKKKGLDVNVVIENLESAAQMGQQGDSQFMNYPVDLLIEYLKHSHYLFIKQKLPYIANLIEEFRAAHPEYDHIEEDLKFVFPLFVEDFIHHIYEEEDTLFTYILQLEKVQKGKLPAEKIYFQMEQHSVTDYAVAHDAHDDEMAGIRKITANYKLVPEAPLHVKVLYSELQSFESNLKVHAQIENQILFPKAIMIEREVRNKLKEQSKFN